ncbi:hypothetical protein [Lactiplantibacillus fabifermentans]|uniref:Extracellular protein n=2 Tax=Lactiplantibacillus fabifermentans TaxID=483011 RepID=A0A0R2NS41_9LACO|nr:hypothetical protein [Lactiplantibacillus fabifermentans]ETY74092.1 hypothetical protein LFAB_08995 [Lactiplantibacillus fabifermentans T30PCM01]KRO26829.1 hypothetical protein DY78_GL000603 [Lactiplantibacillus fabifermentans DSM 21115]
MRGKKVWLVGLLVLLGLALGTSTSLTASAKYAGHSATPTELRGTWYQYRGKNKWTKMVISKQAVKYNGKTLYTPKKKSWHQLYVRKFNKGTGGSKGIKGYGGANYIFNDKFQYDAQIMGSFWLSAQKVKGKRVMKSYYNMGYFEVYTRQKVKHNYSYQYNGSQYLNKIGR